MDVSHQKELSIIITSYNGLQENTVPCLESIFKTTTDCDFEVVVVDNNSTDGTRDYLRRLASQRRNLKLVLNKSNRGFAGGSNDGINASAGSYLVLLNNDTMVTSGWQERLLRPLRKDRETGMTGPVSNEVGNEQRIFIMGKTPEDIMGEGSAWCGMSKGDTFQTERLGFFCVAIQREVIETIGLLDENFGRGYFEDDDYCIRAREAGYRLVCCEDVFIYHRGSKSFSAAEAQTRALMKKNRKMLEEKHGVKYHPPHPRVRQMDLIEAYLERLQKEGPTEGLIFRINNRLRLLEKMEPRGPLKRLRYERRMNKLRDMIRNYGHVGRGIKYA